MFSGYPGRPPLPFPLPLSLSSCLSVCLFFFSPFYFVFEGKQGLFFLLGSGEGRGSKGVRGIEESEIVLVM